MQTDPFSRYVTPELLLETMAEGVVVLDSSLRIRMWNAAMAVLTGFSAAEALGQPAAWLRSPNCTSTHIQALLEKGTVAEDSCIHGCECSIRNRAGEDIPVIVNARLLLSPSGEHLGVLQTVTDFRPILRLQQEVEELRSNPPVEDGFHGMIGHSKPMRDVFRLVRLAAGSDAAVLIEGESGTGKELAASAIHALSHRSDGPFVRVNCGALTETLLDGELFGHVKGAFTGAYKDRIGRFEAADGGTIFLDEIGEISPSMQVKLLRVLQEGEFERVGESQTRRTDVRVIAATNRDLGAELRAGRFREDLFYRLRVFPLKLPPLRERMGDVPLLVNFFVQRFAAKTGRSIGRVDTEAMRLLTMYDWPGNIRELENAVEYAFVVCHGEIIQVDHLPTEVIRGKSLLVPETVEETRDEPRRFPAVSTRKIKANPERLVELLVECDWNKAEVARRLGVSRTLVWKWMKLLGMSLQPEEN